MKAYILVTVRAGELRDVVKELRKIKGVTEAHVTFGPYDAVAVAEAHDLAELGDLMAGSIQPIPGVERTLTCLAVDI